AEEKLYMTYARSRKIHGMQELSKVSRFMKELPDELLERKGSPIKKPTRFFKEDGEDMGIPKSRPDQNRMFVKQFRNDGLEQQKQRMMGRSGGMDLTANTKQAWPVGDRVNHRKFGLGVIEEVQPLNADCQVTVNFARVGTKKLIAGLAGLKKVE
ncbi:MAG: hypothetical protein IJ315_10135, partial [Firmicutes bacterium]|nr:hypothetical protein [Bacillota bacterium]